MVPLGLRRGRQEERSHSPGSYTLPSAQEKRKGLRGQEADQGDPSASGSASLGRAQASWTGSDVLLLPRGPLLFAGPPVQSPSAKLSAGNEAEKGVSAAPSLLKTIQETVN